MKRLHQCKSSAETLIMGLLMLATAVGITVTGIVYGQSFWRMLPLYVSLLVMLLNSRVNRYGLLVGSFNSLLYAAVFWYYGLYASMVSAVAVSFTLQMVTFILWNRKPYGSSTLLRRLTARQRLLLGLSSLPVIAVAVRVLGLVNASHSLLDTLITVLGMVVTLLQLLSYMEYALINTVSCLLQIVLYAIMIREQPEQSTYLVYTVYSLVCIVRSVFSVRQLYREQQNAKKECKGLENTREM